MRNLFIQNQLEAKEFPKREFFVLQLVFLVGVVLLFGGTVTHAATPTKATPNAPAVHELAQWVDDHYNRLRSLRTSFTEQYSGMGQHRSESGTMLLAKPGRMRWQYRDNKLFVLDGKYAVSYVPGDAQAQRISAKHLDDARSPLRFLLGHTRLEKELDGLHAVPGPAGTVTLVGVPHGTLSSESSRIEQISLRIQPASGAITRLEVHEIDGSSTTFEFSDMQENVPIRETDFRFTPPSGVTIVDGLPPA